jgi:hypothetical protein
VQKEAHRLPPSLAPCSLPRTSSKPATDVPQSLLSCKVRAALGDTRPADRVARATAAQPSSRRGRAKIGGSRMGADGCTERR